MMFRNGDQGWSNGGNQQLDLTREHPDAGAADGGKSCSGRRSAAIRFDDRRS